jgi:VanZ family protein
MNRYLRLCAWALLAFIVFATVSPIEFRPHDILPVDVDRALAFMLMSIAFVVAYPRHFRLCCILLLASAGVIEALQLIAPGRHAQVHDILVKMTGAEAGLVVGWVLLRLIPMRHATKRE